MRLLIVTPLLPPESGGPSYYAVGLKEALERVGHTVDVIAFREVRRYPTGIRHLLFLYLVLWRGLRADAFIILDTVSVALPAVIAGWLLFKKIMIRTGGDFVWEHYVERTKEKVLLSEFYKEPRALSRKEKFLIWLQKNIIFKLAHKIVFSTAWQRDIWSAPYAIPEHKIAVIENTSMPSSGQSNVPRTKTVIWIGRDLILKNLETLDAAFKKARQIHPDIELHKLVNTPHEEVMEELKTAMCLVLPSLSEVSPNLALEALSFGTPVILTKDCGLRDTFSGSIRWVDPRNIDDIADALGEAAQKMLPNIHIFTIRTYDDIAHDVMTHVKQ